MKAENVIQNLKKRLNETVALIVVNITIRDGEFFGLLGPNGAGKTTTINILTGLVRKNEGVAKIFGKDIISDYRFTRAQVGISAQDFTQDWFFPLDKLLYFQVGYYGITKDKVKDKVDELLSRLGLEEKRNSRLRQLSGGMRRRFQIAKALVHDPKILILDEPTAGVDVELRHELWKYFKELHTAGKTILLTTHYIEEAEMLCDKVAIIDKGKVIKEGSPKSLTSQSGKSGININLSDTDINLDHILSDFTYTNDDGRLHFTTQEPEETLPVIINLLTNAGCHIQRVETTKSSLEDVFLSLTGKGINE